MFLIEILSLSKVDLLYRKKSAKYIMFVGDHSFVVFIEKILSKNA